MLRTITETNFEFPNQKSFYRGKVRDVYNINDEYLIMIASDRISAFDVVLPKGIPYKGQILNQIANKFLDETEDICPNWKIMSPDPNVTIGRYCEIYPIEMIIRGYLVGSAWRTYKSGVRIICGVELPDGMKENQKFPVPIITPTTKAKEGHDEDISEEEILKQGLISKEEYEIIKKYTCALFERGTQIAKDKGLILVDTKYEFGKGKDDSIYLCDEIHTPDSSRYFYIEGFEDRFKKCKSQKQLSKEFVREWLMSEGFMGQKDQKIPKMNVEKIAEISGRYVELYEKITGDKFLSLHTFNIEKRIEENILKVL